MGENEMKTNNNDTSTTSLLKLPNGWIELMDPTSGQTYYFNEETNESSWDMPLVVDQQQDESLVISSSELQKEVGGGDVAFTNDDALLNSDTDVIDNSMI